ncbi:MAG: LysR family transcriptional regulator [Myxococcales bacterium]|nr:LysR family transcriptional regulator [Myxococcales bacterium]
MPDRPPMRDLDLRQVDLNLLVPLAVLLRHRHISRAGRELGLSQPAMSRALGRLRQLFDDELLVQAGGNLKPTPRAEALEPALQQVLASTMQLLHGAPFDPEHAEGEVSIGIADVLAYMFAPHLIATFAARTRGLRLRLRHWEADIRSHLASGEVELTFGHPPDSEPGIYAQPLLSVDWACVLRKGHPALARPWDLDTFCEQQHALVTVTPEGHGGGQIDEALALLGRTRQIALRMPYSGISPLLIAETDLVLTTSRWLARKVAGMVEIEVRQPPFAIDPMPLPMVWHERTHRDPRARWVRGLVAEAAASIPDEEALWPADQLAR